MLVKWQWDLEWIVEQFKTLNNYVGLIITSVEAVK